MILHCKYLLSEERFYIFASCIPTFFSDIYIYAKKKAIYKFTNLINYYYSKAWNHLYYDNELYCPRSNHPSTCVHRDV